MSKKTYKILIVDDEPDILEFVGYNLRKEGYEVETAGNGQEALEMARKTAPDLILLDVMMPGMDGVETCDEIRNDPQISDTLIAFLTARSEDYSQVAGFDAGADDYITKPIKPKILLSRIKALLRRKALPEDKKDTLRQFGDLVIDTDKYHVSSNGQPVELPRKEFELLALLTSNPGRVFQRNEILVKIWGSSVVVGGRTIDVHVRKLREKLGNQHIVTVKGVGYKFEA